MSKYATKNLKNDPIALEQFKTRAGINIEHATKWAIQLGYSVPRSVVVEYCPNVKKSEELHATMSGVADVFEAVAGAALSREEAALAMTPEPEVEEAPLPVLLGGLP